MKISVMSDVHFGFGHGEMWEDSFNAMEEAMEKSKDSDVILIAGDLFDTKIPTTETLVRAMQVFIKPIKNKKDVRIIEGIDKDISRILPITKSGTPVIAINGNHDRRTKDFINPVQALEKAGFLIHLHCNGVVLEKDGERVSVQGLSAVPDQYFESVLKQWNPKLISGCKNILLIHQLLSPFTFSEHKLEIMPRGFDLYVCGDLHEKKKTYYYEAPFLIPGSVIPTQINKEAVNPRGFWIVDFGDEIKIEFAEFKNQRTVYYIEKQFKNSEDIENEIRDILQKNHNKKPIIRVNIKNDIDLALTEIRKKYEYQAMISFKKGLEEAREIKTAEQHATSVKEIGRNILLENLKAFALDEKIFEEIFELLLENKPERALELLRKE